MKSVAWISSSHKDLGKLPTSVQRKIYEALDLAKEGLTSNDAEQMKGDLSLHVYRALRE